ncbi:MAG: DnaJ C-terminal domain-containing protein [Gemmataceae bacterium]
MPRDLYDILGVKRDANEEDIRKAYRKLARQYHPDRNPGDKEAEQKFKEVQEAYDVLSDKTKRSNYDRFGTAEPGAGFGGFGGGGGPYTQTFRWGPGGGGGTIDESQLEEILRQFTGDTGGFGDIFGQEVRPGFGRAGRRARPQPSPEAPDMESEVTIPFRTAALGGKVSLNVNGRQLDVNIQEGAQEGQKLRLKGQAPGGGNLLLKLHIEPHPYFQRDGNDIILKVPISLVEAVLGTKVDVPTLEGTKLTVTIPPGTSTGKRLRLRGKGIRGGDQYIEIQVAVPPKIDERGRQLIEEFARLHPHNPRADVGW